MIINDSYQTIKNENISVYIEFGGNRFKIFDWFVDICGENTNAKGHIVQYILPKIKSADPFTLFLESKFSGMNSYKLQYTYKPDAIAPEFPILNL